MGDLIERMIRAIHQLFEEFGVHVREDRVLRYVAGELDKGRRFDEILADPYVVNNTDEQGRNRLLEKPETLRAVEEQLLSMRRRP